MTTETIDYPATGIPSSYAVTARPTPTRRPSTVSPQLLGDLQDTMAGGDALCFSVEGLDDKAANRLAARLNAVGRRAGRDFTVRTRRQGAQLFAWAVPKQPVRPRAKKASE